MMIKSQTLQDLEYYTALFELYVEQIRQSGLLLDEDLEILVNFYPSNILHQFPKYKPSLKLKSSLASLLGSLVLAKHFYSKWVILPSVLFTSASIFLDFRNAQIKFKQREYVENIVNVLKKINSLNSSIKKYMKTRAEIESKSQKDFFKSYNKSIEDFLSKMNSNEIKFFNSNMTILKKLVKYSNNLTDDFNSIKDFKPFQDVPTFDSTDICIHYLTQVQDIQIWLTSKMMNYIGILLLSPNSFTKNEIQSILNTILPNLLNLINEHYERKRKSFNTLRNSITKLTEFRSQKRKPLVSMKMQNTLLAAVDNLSIISEKSSTVFEEIEKYTDKFSPELEYALLDLRNHTFAAYESLDLLCRLYGILLSQNVPTSSTKLTPKETKSTNNEDMTTIHHDDDVDAIEEHFELYLDKDFVPQEEPQHYTENSEAYLSLMLQELRQSLRKHERFMEAKKRRGSVEKERIDLEEKDFPKFDLNVLEDEKDTSNIKEASLLTQQLPSLSPPTSLPPPPPPLPPSIPKDLDTININLLAEKSNVQPNSKSMLDSIKLLSGQLNIKEEVFGEAEDGEDSE